MVTKSSYFFQRYWWCNIKGYPNSGGIPNGIPTIYPPTEAHVREACNAAITMAVTADWGGYLSSAVTLDLAQTRLNSARLVVAVNAAHKLFNGAGWGWSWQSALWAYNLGIAGWLLWNSQLTNTLDRQRLCDIVESEANFQLFNHRPEIWQDSTWTNQVAGASIGGAYYPDGPQGARSGDSAIEENLWNAGLLDLAATMMPGHPNAQLWARRAAMYGISGVMSPHDIWDTTTNINGESPNHWTIGSAINGMSGVWNIGKTGVNVDGNYIVHNHNKRNPDYMQACVLTLQAPLWRAMANVPSYEWMRWNQDKMYGAMRTVPLDYTGKSFYWSTTDPSLYQPDGVDWGIKRFAGYWEWDSLVETMITGVNGTTPDIPVSPTTWDNLHGNASIAMQDRVGVMPGGQIVLNSTEDAYGGREGWHASSAAYIVLNKTLNNAGRFTWSNATI